jgi:SAM-dependent methyltransferase
MAACTAISVEGVMGEEEWRSLNWANWEARVPIHVGPDGYDLAAFDDPAHISDIVRFDLPRLGSVEGLDVVHLQCHVGTDTVSLARLGARSVTGVDFSPAALAAARGLSQRAGAVVEWVEADVYDAVTAVGGGRFDLVFTGIGALCWLPSVAAWAQVVAGLLRPGGRLFLREGHPLQFSLADPRPDGLLVLEHPYFETSGVRSSDETTYLGDGRVTATDTIEFNHGLGEVIGALQLAGLRFDSLIEHDSVPWNVLGDILTRHPDYPGEYVFADPTVRLPLTYTVQATKPVERRASSGQQAKGSGSAGSGEFVDCRCD